MSRNNIKIISNGNIKSVSYYFQNELDEWTKITNSSILSRKEYTQVNFLDKVQDILMIILEQYNPGNRGVNIYFEGNENEFAALEAVIQQYFKDEDIECILKITKIAVAGKLGSGKTTFIEAISRYMGGSIGVNTYSQYKIYKENYSNIIWYEINGIDVDAASVTNTEKTLDNLANNGLSFFIYCLSTNKIENVEEQIIVKTKKENPDITLLVLLTCSTDEENDLYAEKLSKQLGGIKVIPVLAKDLKTRSGVIPAYGMDMVTKFLFGGRYIG